VIALRRITVPPGTLELCAIYKCIRYPMQTSAMCTVQNGREGG
jgi:hypothetical protein